MRVPGIRLDIAPGTEVLVRYESLDSTRPFVADFGTNPASVLRAEVMGGTTPVALQGMAVQVTIQPTSISCTNGTVTVSGPPNPVVVTGTITGGSATFKGNP
jgi:hypothetical protein